MTAQDEPTALPLNLHEYEWAARAALPPMTFGYVAGGAEDEVTRRENRAAFDRWRLLPRVLTGVSAPSLATTVLGREIALPVLIAPTGFHRLHCEDGERATARAARALGTLYTMSTAASLPIETIAPEAGAGGWWFQLYVYRDRGITRDLVARAEVAGAAALVVTVDVPALGRREADDRNRFALPPELLGANVRLPAEGRQPVDGGDSGLAAFVAGADWEPALTWDDLDWLAGLTSLPVVPKGILHPADAVRALDHGARAILVSNHGGRQLDSAVASLDALPAVAAAVGGRGEVYLDGGIRRGTDVVKALALGARAVFVGRPILWGLAVAGEAGARRVLELLQAELVRDLLLCGVESPAAVDRALVVPAGRPLAF